MTSDRNTAPHVAIVGAGFGGIGMGIRLKAKTTYTFTIYDRSDRIGGTWRDNTYPGAACDVPSELYSYSFETPPEWSRRYAPQHEIQAYLEACVRRNGLAPHLRMNRMVTRATWDDDARQWVLGFVDGEEETADAVVFAVGQLNRPTIPSFPGEDEFRGRRFHSAQWQSDWAAGNQRVGIIGSGATAVQLVPQLAPQVASLTLFQRSAPWVLPKPVDTYSPTVRWLFRHIRVTRRIYRARLYWQREFRFVAFRDKGTAVGRRRRLLATEHLHTQVGDPILRAKLTPDYAFGCKRVLISSDYYPALTRDNVEVVTDPIDGFYPGGIRTKDGRQHALDAVIYATGFAATDFLAPIKVKGRDGTSLEEEWRDGAHAHLGITVPGFPNMFILYGPNTNLAGNTIIFMIECQIRYAIACLRWLIARRAHAIEVRREALRRYERALDARLARTVWADRCNSWYKTAAGKITQNWPDFTSRYWLQTRIPRRRDFVPWT